MARQPGYLTIEKIEHGCDANDGFENTLRWMGIERQDVESSLRDLGSRSRSGSGLRRFLRRPVHEDRGGVPASSMLLRLREAVPSMRSRNMLESWLAPLSWKWAVSSSILLKSAHGVVGRATWCTQCAAHQSSLEGHADQGPTYVGNQKGPRAGHNFRCLAPCLYHQRVRATHILRM